MTLSGGKPSQDVKIQDQITGLMNLYLHTTVAEPSLSSPTAIDNTSIAVADATGVVAGQAITILESSSFYQGLVLSVGAGPVIELSAPISAVFTAPSIRCGAWNANVSGTRAAPGIYYVEAPPAGAFDIYTLTLSITDGSDMDSGKFGGITALTNGIVLRRKNSTTYNIANVVNNLGFAEQGFTLTYDPKAPAGVYGLLADQNIHDRKGVVPRLSGADGDRFELLVQDDLTALSQLTVVVGGHLVED